MNPVLGPSLLFVYVSFSQGVKVHWFLGGRLMDIELSHDPGPSQKKFPSTSSSLPGFQTSVEPLGPVIAVSPKKKHGPQKGVIKGTMPDSEVWDMDDDEIIGIVPYCLGMPHVLICQ